MKLAAIDIGSNAVRLQVTKVLEYEGQLHFKKLEYVRFPLRLGHDVFAHGCIRPHKVAQFVKLMRSFQLLIDLYEVDHYLAYATSAMREAANGHTLVQQVKAETGLKIQVIDGEKEAAFINQAVLVMLDHKPYLHIDVGGGSTELTLLVNGAKQASRSFPIGSVRRLGHHEAPEVWEEMKAWVRTTVDKGALKVTAVGTGGNINKLFDLAGKKPGKVMSREKVAALHAELAAMPMDERLNRLRLNPDRADVIVPASEIYLQVMRWAHAKAILVPNVGLKDGMLRYLFHQCTVDN